MPYNHLSTPERYQIFALHGTGKKPSEIARFMRRSRSTIGRELRRNTVDAGTYTADTAVLCAATRRKISAKNARQVDDTAWDFAKSKVLEQWSPEQIAGYLVSEEGLAQKGLAQGLSSCSHETIYQRILADKIAGGVLYTHLRCQKRRKKRYGSVDNRGKLQGRIGIEQRPAEVEKRERIGDWEADLVIGKDHQGALLTVVERKTGYTLIAKLANKEAQGVKDAMIDLLANYRDSCHTLTTDNGREFAQHTEIAKALSAGFYFARPYHSWERGTNENTNGLIRQYFPKEANLLDISQTDIVFAMHQLNNRPRKRLKYLTPAQAFAKRHSTASQTKLACCTS